MTVRSINRAEAPAFLRLLCDVFELDYGRAEGIFYSEPMFDLDRKWALFDGDEMLSIMTTVPLTFGWGKAIGIAGVATRVENRGRGYAAELLQGVLQASKGKGEGVAFLFARDETVYTRVGFKTLDTVIRAQLRPSTVGDFEEVLTYSEVHNLYNAWALQHPDRLRRDEQRWRYWKWNLRTCCPFNSGYLCVEGSLVRECVSYDCSEPWPLSPGSEWYGLSTMAEMLNAPLENPEFDLYLMGYGIDHPPQMFMTDQF